VSGLKRGRGRPRKEAVSHPPRSKSIEVDGQITSFLAALDTNTTLLQNNNKENDDDGITPTSSKRGRGRPRKEVLLRESKSSFVGVSPPHPLAAKEEQKIDGLN
jgi:hypothetical protein